ncbi:phosphotransferase family protein [Sciscionella marina]|uniref:phosphotransferase family protein n=1 Tax=Sciscionella marina TaxID=508770 RepID=UPI000477CA0E|nr:aminoglycoside phosphotransferase family protein [Sciscionella marina]
MTAPLETADDVLATAAQLAGVDATNAAMIRDGSNVMYRLPDGIVARIGPEHTHNNAMRQVEVARWLSGAGLAVVRALDDVPQPTMVGTRPVTWWEQLPEHRPATTEELGAVLRSLHALSPPTHPELPHFDPFAGLDERIAAARYVPEDDRNWLARRVEHLREQLDNLRLDQAPGVVHGDAWQGNVAVPETGAPVLLDLEHVSRGHPDWDLIPVAVDYADFARLTSSDYHDFVAAYGGHDVTTTSAFRDLADIQELRWVVFVLGKAASSSRAANETRHRIACLRGEIPRPWTWTAF